LLSFRVLRAWRKSAAAILLCSPLNNTSRAPFVKNSGAPHSVVTTLYARNTAGQLDAFAVYSATDWAEARQVIERRGIDLIVACIPKEIYTDASNGPDTLDSGLRRGEAPDWLRPLELGESAQGLYRIYRVKLADS